MKPCDYELGILECEWRDRRGRRVVRCLLSRSQEKRMESVEGERASEREREREREREGEREMRLNVSSFSSVPLARLLRTVRGGE